MREVPGMQELLAGQDGMVTHHQLHDLGLSRGAVRWALGHGWCAVLPSVMPEEVLARIERAYLAAGRRPRPDVVARSVV